jgi:chemotaxis protein methyltransferase CheR
VTPAGSVPRRLPELSDREFAQFQRLIYEEAGIRLLDDKRTLVSSRLARRMRELALPSFGAYYRRIVSGVDDELTRMLDAITTNETHFFREERQFTLLANDCCREWGAQAAAGVRPRKLRIWSAACSTGEEPYSIAMVLHDRLATEGWEVSIIASDLCTTALAHAREGVWPVARVTAVPKPLLKRHFLRGVGPEAGRAKISPAIRAMVDFRRLNLSDERYSLEGRFDAIFCRNALIYFDSASRADVLGRLVRYLAPGGFLFLGHAESLVGSPIRLATVMPAVYRLPPAAGARAS